MIYLEKELRRIRTDWDFLNMVVTPQEFGGTLVTVSHGTDSLIANSESNILSKSNRFYLFSPILQTKFV